MKGGGACLCIPFLLLLLLLERRDMSSAVRGFAMRWPDRLSDLAASETAEDPGLEKS
jgi:hypothetical protein